MLGQLREIVLSYRALARLLELLLDARPILFVGRGIDQPLEVDPVVPDVQRLHEGILRHVFPVGAHRSASGARRLALRELDMTPGEDHARGQALDVPFPWSGKRLIQVIDVEDHAALGRGKGPEVRQVSVTTGLHPKAGARGVGQVGGHDRGGPAIKGEGRLGHPAMANRNEIQHPALVRGEDDLDRIRSLRGRLPSAMVRAGHGVPEPLALARRSA